MNTFYWHDYETWGATPSVDRASQFAGVRTDEDLNIVGDPLVIYCKPPEDMWPQPEACLITGILPQVASDKGLLEAEFIAKIHAELAVPKTCGVGYNSLRFDDEVTRYTLYRNFYDPYEREWKNGNSRWDIIDMVRLVYALRPEGIEWPLIDGKPSFKLESLTAANGISHQSAHDAFSDVEATIGLAKLIKTTKPALYAYVVNNRSKRAVGGMIDLAACKPLLHISSRFPASRGCAGIIAPLAMHPINKNAVIVYDLSVDPSPMASLSPEQIRERVFTREEDLPEGEYRLPIKLVHLNKCPVLATTKLLDPASAQRLGIDKAQCETHWGVLRAMNIGATLQAMYALDSFTPSEDAESQLYNGFIGNEDKRLMTELRRADSEALATENYIFDDSRLNAMLGRYKARNFPAALSAQETAEWNEYVAERLTHGGDNRLSYDELTLRLDLLAQEHQQAPEKCEVLAQLRRYARAHLAKFSSLPEESAL
ncbi:MAG: exodeoxyribonuclease I [Agarilytica sp.]